MNELAVRRKMLQEKPGGWGFSKGVWVRFVVVVVCLFSLRQGFTVAIKAVMT